MLRFFSAPHLFLPVVLLLGKSYTSLVQAHNALTPVSSLEGGTFGAPHVMFSKRSTIHTAIAKGQPGYSDWKIRYIKVASLMPVQFAAAKMASTYMKILAQLASIDFDSQLTRNAGEPFELYIGGTHLNFYAPVGKLTKDFVIEVGPIDRL